MSGSGEPRFVAPHPHQRQHHGEYVMTTVRPLSWVERNLSVIVTVVALGLGGAVTWGTMLSNDKNFEARLETIELVLRGTTFVEGPAKDVEQDRRINYLESTVSSITSIIADMRAYDARMEERLAGLTSQLTRIEAAVSKIADQVDEFTRLAIP